MLAAPRILLVFACLWLAAGAETIHAQLYWDTNGSAVNSGNAGGIWGTSAFWSTSAIGTAATGAYVAGSNAVFAAGTDGTGAYTVTVATGFTPTAAGINFQEGHITLAPTTPLTESITLTGAAPTVNVQNMDSIITTKLVSSGLTKTGVGKLTLNYTTAGTSSYFNFSGAPVTINGGTLELIGTGTGANQLNAANGIVVNSGGTFLWAGAANNISDGALITINTGGTLVNKVGDQIGGLAGSGLISMQGGAVNLSLGNAVNTFSGLIMGGGTLQTNAGTGALILTNANTFSGTITALVGNVGTGGIRLGNRRAAQNAAIKLNNTTVTAVNLSFAGGIGTFVVGSIEGISNLVLQDVTSTAITLQAGNNDVSTTYKGILSGSGGLAKIGTGTLTLTGETSGASTYSGDTTINGGAHNSTSASISSTTAGTLKLDFTPAAAPSSNIINSASRLVLGGGRLLVAGKNDATTASQTFNGTQLNAGRSYATVTLGTASAGTVVNLGSISRSAGGVVEFTLPAGTQSLTNGITTTRANDAGGILGAWATVGLEWAAKDTAGSAIGNVVAAAAGVYSAYSSGDITSTTGTNLLINNTATTITTAAGTTDTNTIMVRNNLADNATVNRVLDVAAGETLRLGAAGGIWSQGAGTLKIGGTANTGVLTAGGADNTDGEIIVNSGGADITINSAIKNNGSGVVTLVRTGPSNTLILAGTNTYTGGTILTQGRTRVDSAGGLSSGSVSILPGAQLWIGVNATFNNDITIAGSGHGEGGIPGAVRFSSGTLAGTITLAGDTRIGSVNGATGTLSGKITGDYGLDLAGGASGTNVIVLSNTANDFGGNLSINTNLNATTSYNTAVIVVRLGAEGVIPSGAGKGNVILSGGATGSSTLDLNGGNETINSLISYGTHANTFITNSKAGTTATLTIGDNNASTLVAVNATYSTFFGGALQDSGTGILALNKIGEGTQTVTGANTYSGVTTISKGILQAGAVNTLSANSAVVIASDATAMLALTNGIADFSQTIQSLSGGGTVNLGTIAAADTVGAPATRLATGGSADTLYSGTIVGAGGLVKQGTGRFTLAGNNSYVGTTTVSTGSLQVGVAGAGRSGTGAVTVNANAILSGTGLVQGATTVNGTIRPGDTGGSDIGRLVFSDPTTSSLTLSGGGSSASPRIEFTLAGATGNEASPLDGIQTAALLDGVPAAGTHDSIEVQGTLNLDAGSTIKVVLANGYSPMWGDVFNLIDWGTLVGGAGAINANGFNASATGGDLDLEISSLMTANGWTWNTDQFLASGVVYVVPEPGRASFLLVGFALVMMRGRRRRAW